jgi:hypothetical protein
MTFTATERKLSQITDEGLFEKLAMAVLLDAEPDYRAMVHTGINVDGKTIKSPVDGILYRTDIDPPLLVVVHHTTAALSDLRKKWLLDPETVKFRQGKKPTAPEGDVLKAISVIADERRRVANLRAILVLSTNREPGSDIVRDVGAAALRAGIGVDIWQRSRLAHFLDTTARGQWLRRQYLGIDADILSRNLLLELSKASISIHAPRDVPEAWISRDLDSVLATAAQRKATFLVAPSGFGKSIAGYRWLIDHISLGGAGLVLSHDVIANSLTISDAIDLALRKLCPSLERGAGIDALALSSAHEPLYLIVEDINISGQAALLTERIDGWARGDAGNTNLKHHYRLVCSLWPDVLASLNEQTLRSVSAAAVFGSSFTAIEGRHAVQRRAMLSGRSLSHVEADAISAALGHDPLLIALQSRSEATASNRVIDDFVEGVLGRVASSERDHTATDYRRSLRAFAGGVMHYRTLNPLWAEVRHWREIDADDLRRLSHLMHEGNLLHLSGQSIEQRVGYRHDRVRDWLLTDAIDGLATAGALPDSIIEEPYFAELVGAFIARSRVGADFVSCARGKSPLALFHALRALNDSTSSLYKQIVTAIESWLSDPSTHGLSSQHLRFEALAALSQTDGPDVVRLVSLFRVRGWTAWQARFRNGDIGGGIELCAALEPGAGAPWRDIQIEHAKHKFGRGLVQKLDALLRQRGFDSATRMGVLRLAGHVGDFTLGDAIAACWEVDAERQQHLADYLWACAECCGTDAERYLKPICDVWATLPSSLDDDKISPTRDSLAANQLRWAFRKWVPTEAIRYLVKRAGNQDDLRWPITYMLQEIDDPVAVLFVVREMGEMQRRVEGTPKFSPWAAAVPSFWRRHQETDGLAMSEASRHALQALWIDPSTDKHLRISAFRLWAATHAAGDLMLLCDPTLPADLADSVLHARLLRGDRGAIPALLERIKEPEKAPFWWNLMKHVWSDDLLSVLDVELQHRTTEIPSEWHAGTDTDYATSDLVMRLSPERGEALLTKNWAKLQYVRQFVQAALYHATPNLQDMVSKVVNACPDPKSLFQFIGQHFGLRTHGHPGISRKSQMAALVPYLQYLAHHDVVGLCEVCNRLGWFSLRRSILDPHLRAAGSILYEDEAPTFAALDSMIEDKRVHWIYHWLERYAETGATTAMIMARIGVWFRKRKTLEALILVHHVLATIGRRSDLAILDTALDTPEPSADAIRMDAEFAVKRRGCAQL